MGKKKKKLKAEKPKVVPLYKVINVETGRPAYPGKGVDKAQAEHLGRGLVDSEMHIIVELMSADKA